MLSNSLKVFRYQPHQLPQVYPKKSQETIETILIQRKHVYHSDPTLPNKHSHIIFKLTFDEIWEVTKEMHKMQILADLVFDQKWKLKDSPAGEQKQQIKTNMLKLKNGLAENKDDVVVCDDDTPHN